MTQEKRAVDVTVKNRREVSVSGVASVVGFDDDYCLLRTDGGEVTVRGEELSLVDLKSADGSVRLTGNVLAVEYGDGVRKTLFGRRK